MPRAKAESEVEDRKGATESLPKPDQIKDADISKRAAELLDEALKVKLRHDKDADRLKEITDELIAIVRGYELPGVRNNGIGLLYNGERSNQYLDKGLLLEHGVAPEVIQQSYKPTKVFSDARLMLLKRR